jgi:hypothetical protein
MIPARRLSFEASGIPQAVIAASLGIARREVGRCVPVDLAALRPLEVLHAFGATLL